MSKILLLDIETAPNTAFVWGLFDQNIAHDHLVESSYILCWAAKWLDQRAIISDSCQDRSRYKLMMTGLHTLLEEADVVVHYYGSKFDIPTVNKEFTKLEIPPPAPYKQVDLKLVVGRVFRFESNKLDYVAEQLGFGRKMETDFQLWVDCMNNVAKAWEYMRQYNKHDVVLLEKMYLRLLPWIDKHPNVGPIDRLACPKCSSDKVQRRGEQVARELRYTRWHCQGCGSWFRSNKATKAVKVERGVNV